MKRSLLKLIFLLGFSVVLTTAGVAWALQGCALLGHTTAHSDAFDDASVSVQENAHRLSERIHCPEEKFDKLLFGSASSALRLENVFELTAELFDRGDPRNLTTALALATSPEVRFHISPHLLLSRLRI